MRTLVAVLFLAAAFALPFTAKADTVNFTVTITQQLSPQSPSVGTIYSGYLHYEGSYDINSTTFPPTPTSYAFDYPSAPDSLSDFKWAILQRASVGSPLVAGLMYVDYSYPGASFYFSGPLFGIWIPTYEDEFSVSGTNLAIGTVTYTYAADPPSTVPEPSSILLAATGVLSAFGIRRSKNLSA